MQMRQTGILDSIAAPAANPRMRQAAAEQIVDADVPNELQALVEKKKALELLQSAARREVMRQRPPPAPPQTTKTQVEGGIASLLKDLLPGLTQRGQQLRRMSTRRQAGLPTVPSNMRMAASGGIVGYDSGGNIEIGSGQPIPMLMERYGSEKVMEFLNEEKRLKDIESNVAPELRKDFEMMKTNIESRFDPEMIRAIRRARTGPDEIGKAGGGVIGFNNRGAVSSLDAALEAEGITDPVAIELIRAIYGQESSSGRNAKVSPAGARGPMQVMPATFVEMMGPDADISDPATNLRAGARYAQKMLRQAGGDPRLAAAAYYGGPDEIAKQRAGIDTPGGYKGFPSVSEYANEVFAGMRTAPEPVDRLINPDDLKPTDGGIANIRNDDSRFGVTTDTGMSRKEAIAADMQSQNIDPEPNMESPTTEERGLPAIAKAQGIDMEPNRIGRGRVLGGQGTGDPVTDSQGQMGERVTLRGQGTGDPVTDSLGQMGRNRKPKEKGTRDASLLELLQTGPRRPSEPEETVAPKPARDIDFDGLIAFLTSAQGTNTAAALGSGARGFTRQQLAERRRQDELDALAEKQKIDREQIAANLARTQATQDAAIQKILADYRASGGGFDMDLARFLDKDVADITQEDRTVYGPRVTQEYLQGILRGATLAQLPEGVTVTRKDS